VSANEGKPPVLTAEVEARWANLRAGSIRLSEREALQFAQPLHERRMELHRDKPSEQTFWDVRVGAQLFGAARATRTAI
jgi:hypothetical protein